MSASLLLRQMRERADRWQIPLFSDGAGVVLRPSATLVLCAYVGDGATQAANCHPPGLSESCVPGCSHPAGECRADSPYSADFPWCLCGLGWCLGDRPQPWGAAHLDAMISAYLEHGDRYKPARGFMSGYNEVIVGGEHWSCHMPHAIEAFFVVDGKDLDQTRRKRAAFLEAYGLSGREAEQVPLLDLRVDDWEEPFRLVM